MEYYIAELVKQKKKAWMFATTWMNLDGIMLSVVGQRKAKSWFHCFVESKHTQMKEHKTETVINTENKQVVVWGRVQSLSETGDRDQEVQT